jgi:hypothetical protein
LIRQLLQNTAAERSAATLGGDGGRLMMTEDEERSEGEGESEDTGWVKEVNASVEHDNESPGCQKVLLGL